MNGVVQEPILMTEPEGAAEVMSLTQSEAQARGEIDIQIATARRYPRDITRFMKAAETLATLNDDMAASCFYKLKRRDRDGGEKPIEGPSVRLAEIIASTWGHMRVAARTVNEDGRFVYAQGIAWDLERNVAIQFETRRRITGRNGNKYSDDMIATTANAAAAIALRNAIFRVVPKAFWEPIYDKAKAVAVGTEKTLGERRQKMLDYFVQKVGVSLDRVFAYLGVEGIESINLKHVEDLRGLATALKEGDAKAEEAFPDPNQAKQTAEQAIDELLQVYPDAQREGIARGFDVLNLTPAQRLVLLRKHGGNAEALLDELKTSAETGAGGEPAAKRPKR